MDDEWSKGYECMESALLPFPFCLVLFLFVPLVRSRERNRNERSPRQNTLATSQYIPDRPVYGAAMMEPASGRSCTFRLGYKLVIFYEFYTARHETEIFGGHEKTSSAYCEGRH